MSILNSDDGRTKTKVKTDNNQSSGPKWSVVRHLNSFDTFESKPYLHFEFSKQLAIDKCKSTINVIQ